MFVCNETLLKVVTCLALTERASPESISLRSRSDLFRPVPGHRARAVKWPLLGRANALK